MQLVQRHQIYVQRVWISAQTAFPKESRSINLLLKSSPFVIAGDGSLGLNLETLAARINIFTLGKERNGMDGFGEGRGEERNKCIFSEGEETHQGQEIRAFREKMTLFHPDAESLHN